ncbi:hypothetical protein O3P69_014092 [Scylla paramamosain]|uniref:Uncharacterized protein n=1 Tax=Scylla paramamosain TaxID=85552 RepID=A0AAW0SR85_SCYPA
MPGAPRNTYPGRAYSRRYITLVLRHLHSSVKDVLKSVSASLNHKHPAPNSQGPRGARDNTHVPCRPSSPSALTPDH